METKIEFRVSEALKKRVKSAAKKEKISVSEWIRNMITEKLKRKR